MVLQHRTMYAIIRTRMRLRPSADVEATTFFRCEAGGEVASLSGETVGATKLAGRSMLEGAQRRTTAFFLRHNEGILNERGNRSTR
jgi:hypothetical protein